MRPVLAVAAAFVVLCGLAASARADDAAVVYDPATVTTVDVSLSEAAMVALRTEPKEYVDGGVSFTLPDGRVLGPYAIGVKTKGNATLLPIDEKAALKLKFAHSVKKQKVLGLKGMTLNNLIQDDSGVRETLTYSLFRAAGVPASRTGYAYVRLNGVGKGLYLNLEPYDEVSLARLFPGGTQHLYEGESTADFTTAKRDVFKVEEGDEDDRADLDAAVAAAAGWPGNASSSFARASLVTMWATEQFVAHFDGYSPNDAWYAPNNYYVQSDPGGRFSMLPSGVDQTLITWNKDIANSDPSDTGKPVLWTNCKANAGCLAEFRTALNGVSKTASTIELGKQAAVAAATVAKWRPCAAQNQPNAQWWRQQLVAVNDFLSGRRAEVASYLGHDPASPPSAIAVSPPPAAGIACPAPAVPVTPVPTPTPTPTPTASPTATPTASPTATATPAPTTSPAPSAEPSPVPPATTPPVGRPSAPAPGQSGVAGTVESRTCVVPDLRGRTPQRARRLLRASGCKPGSVVRRGDGKRVRRGGWRIRRSHPGRGARRSKDVKIVLLAVPKR